MKMGSRVVIVSNRVGGLRSSFLPKPPMGHIAVPGQGFYAKHMIP